MEHLGGLFLGMKFEVHAVQNNASWTFSIYPISHAGEEATK